MRTGSHYHLICGHAHSRRAEILRDGVECPSISPEPCRCGNQGGEPYSDGSEATSANCGRKMGYSQEGLSLAAKLNRTYYSDVERGERNVSLENIVRIATALDLSMSEFFEGF